MIEDNRSPAGRGPRGTTEATRTVVALATTLAALAAFGATIACGGSHKQVKTEATRTTTARRDPISPKASKEFEAAMRTLRVGGPEAQDIAKTRLKVAIDSDKTLWEAWYDLGVIAYKEGDDDAAIDAFTRALKIKNGHTPSLLARAEANRRAGHKKDARADYDSALKTIEEDDPNRKDAAARLASLLRDAGDFDDAVEILRNTVRVSGTNAKIYTELGLIYIAQKRLELAQLVLAKAAELDAKDPAIYNAFAVLALRQGKAQEAFDRFDQAVSLDPTYLDARFNKAAVLLDAGDYVRAKTELTTIVEKRPDDYAAYVALGVAQRGLKDFPEAKRTWERVIKEAPRRSTPRADAMFDVAILATDYMNDDTAGKAALDRYLQEAPIDHAKRQAAEEKRKELGK
ncbi:MAG TPA: tetratricopeptide repeat protein [Kofleriaceae bacterium]|jgi:tetratricopeptide (TPR) repeat protein|nr:tetratricopeptide repeat protein [Kofleriaceae bacterium]